jgi:hypothetical protein
MGFRLAITVARSMRSFICLRVSQERNRTGQGRLTNCRFPPVRPDTPPSPLSTVPFTRDPDFVRREKLLDQIYSKTSVAGSRIALIGLGGVG